MRKAITPVISIVVLLLIIIGMVGIGWTYLFGYTEFITKNVYVSPGSAFCSGTTANVVITNPSQAAINNSDHDEMLGLFHNDLAAVGAWRLDEDDGNASLDSSGRGNHGSIYGNTVLLMRFDEGSGNPLDSTSFSNHGDITGHEPTWKSSGCQSGSCLEFDGVDDYVEVADNPSLDITNAITISAWVRPIGETGDYQMYVSKGYATAWAIARFKDTTDFRWYISTTGSGSQMLTETSFVNGNWYHLAMTYDSSTGDWIRYVNGTQTGSSSLSGNIQTNNRPLRVGKVAEWDNQYYVNGAIDEVAIYSRSLTPDEVKAQYDAGKARFIERVPSRFGRAMEFDGNFDYIDCGNGIDFTAGNLTFSAWAYFYDITIDERSIFSQHNAATDLFLLRINKDGSLWFRNLDGVYSAKRTAAGIITTGQWYHIMFVFNDDDDDGYFFVNGEQKGNSDIDDILGEMQSSSNPLSIGKRLRTDGPYDIFNGTLDELTIINRSLSAAEIAAQLTPACSCGTNVCRCGDLTIAKTEGEGGFFPYFSNDTIAPRSSVIMTDYSCLSDSCSYRVMSPSSGVDVTVECS